MILKYIIHFRYYFNKDSGTCQQFYYGGCGGNKNNFKTEKSCQSRCSADFSIPVIEDFKLEFCFLAKDEGIGYGFIIHLLNCLSIFNVHCGICTVITIFLIFEEKAMKASHCNDGTTIALKVLVSNLTT